MQSVGRPPPPPPFTARGRCACCAPQAFTRLAGQEGRITIPVLAVHGTKDNITCSDVSAP